MKVLVGFGLLPMTFEAKMAHHLKSETEAVSCPLCHATKGKPCRSTHGRVRKYSHEERVVVYTHRYQGPGVRAESLPS